MTACTTAGAHTLPDGHHLVAGDGAAGAAADAEPCGLAGDADVVDPRRGAAIPWCARSINSCSPLSMVVVLRRRIARFCQAFSVPGARARKHAEACSSAKCD